MDPKPPKGMLQRVRCTLSISDLRPLSLLVLPLASVHKSLQLFPTCRKVESHLLCPPTTECATRSGGYPRRGSADEAGQQRRRRPVVPWSGFLGVDRQFHPVPFRGSPA